MATNLDLDDNLVKEAQKIGKHPSKKAAVTTALLEYIKHIKQHEIINLFGTVDYDQAKPKKKRAKK